MKQPFLKIQTLCFLFSFYAQYGHPYRLECPKTVQWKLRAKNLCNSNDTDIYYCLKDILKQEYVEGCTGPDWDRKGCKRVISGDFTRDSCSTDRYQPFDFWSNGNTDCVYSKSQCAGQGQLINNNGSGYLDTTCRCDFARGYNYTKLPEDICNCKPVLEDCSCFRDDNSNVNGTKLLDPQYLETNVEDDKDNNLIKYAPSLLSSFQVPRRNAPIEVRVLVFFTLVFSLCVILFLVDAEVNFLSKLRGNPSFKGLFCTADSKQDIESEESSGQKTTSSDGRTESKQNVVFG